MSFQWDPVKSKANHHKHGIHFADAVGVLEDERAVTIVDPHVAEERFVSIGLDLLGRLLLDMA